MQPRESAHWPFEMKLGNDYKKISNFTLENTEHFFFL